MYSNRNSSVCMNLVFTNGTLFCTFKLTLCPGGPWGPATPGGPVKPWNHRSLRVTGISWQILTHDYCCCYYDYYFSYSCSRFPTLPRRPLPKQISHMRTRKQKLWSRATLQGRSYRWSHFAFSWRPPLTGWTLFSSCSWLALGKEQPSHHHPAPVR